MEALSEVSANRTILQPSPLRLLRSTSHLKATEIRFKNLQPALISWLGNQKPIRGRLTPFSMPLKFMFSFCKLFRFHRPEIRAHLLRLLRWSGTISYSRMRSVMSCSASSTFYGMPMKRPWWLGGQSLLNTTSSASSISSSMSSRTFFFDTL